MASSQVAGAALNYVSKDSTNSGKVQDKNLIRGLRFDRGKDWWKDSLTGFGVLGNKISGGGGGDEEGPILPTLTEVAEMYKEAYPTYFGMTQEYAPKEAQLQLDLLRQYGGPIAQAQYDAAESVYPYTTGLQEQLAQRASENIGQGASPWMQKEYLNQMRGILGNQSIGGMGADAQSVGLQRLGFEQDQYFDQMGQAVGNRMPMFVPQIPEYTNIHQGFTPGAAMNYELSGFLGMPAMQDSSGAGLGSLMGGTDWGGMLKGLFNTGASAGGNTAGSNNFQYSQPIGGSSNGLSTNNYVNLAYTTQGLNYR